MFKIQFDTEAHKTRVIEGPFATREALEEACVNNPLTTLEWEIYRLWALDHGVNPDSGSIFTTADNQPLLERRQWALLDQLTNFTRAARGEEAYSKLKYTMPSNLREGFSKAVGAIHVLDRKNEFRVLMIASTRETLFFDLFQRFPWLNFHAVCAVENQEHADRCNNLVTGIAPELSQSLVYKTNWRGQNFNLVSVNAALFYNDENGVKRLIKDIANTGAHQVFFNNITSNTDENGAAQWFGQRYSGGVTPIRTPARGELEKLMGEVDYHLVKQYEAPATFDHNPNGAFTRQYPEMDNFSFALE